MICDNRLETNQLRFESSKMLNTIKQESIFSQAYWNRMKLNRMESNEK